MCLTCNTLHVLEPDMLRFMDENGIPREKFMSIVGATKKQVVADLSGKGEAANVYYWN